LNIGGTAGDTYIQQVSIKLSKVIVKRLTITWRLIG
jgi:hypothetical protein